MHDNFDCCDVHLELKNLIKGSGPIVGLILMPNGPSTFESITMPNDLKKQKLHGRFEGSTHLESENMCPSLQVVSPLP